MSLRERIGRLAQTRRPAWQPDELQRLKQRVEHLEALVEGLQGLEALVEGLQDAIHRDSIRHEERMTEIERKTQPDVLAKALSDDARRRGI